MKIPEGERVKVTFNSKTYYFSLYVFYDFSSVVELKVETDGGAQIRNLHFEKYSTFYDLRVILKERLSDSVIVWIEKIED